MSRKRKRGEGVNLAKPLRKVETFVRNLFGPIRKQAPPHVRKIVSELGDRKIIGLQVGRNPLDKPLQKFLNFISRGKYEKKRRELGYDDLYHTFLVAHLENGEKILIEKNSQVNVTRYYPHYNEELRQLPMVMPVRLETFLDNGQKYFNYHPEKIARPQNYWQYDAATNNCQYFVSDLVKGNTPYIRHPHDVEEFTKQDIVPIMESLPSFAKSTLDLKQHIDHAVHGDGIGAFIHPHPHLIKGQGFLGDVWKAISTFYNYLFGSKNRPPQYMSEHRKDNVEVIPWKHPKDIEHQHNPEYSGYELEKMRKREMVPSKPNPTIPGYISKYKPGTFEHQIDMLDDTYGVQGGFVRRISKRRR